MSIKEGLSIEQLADVCGVNIAVVRYWHSKGLPFKKTGSSKLTRVSDVISFLDTKMRAEIKEDIIREFGLSSDPTTLSEEKLRLTKETADNKAIQNAIARGELASLEEFKVAFQASIALIRGSVMSIPLRTSIELASMEDKAQIKEYLHKECEQSLVSCINKFHEASIFKESVAWTKE